MPKREAKEETSLDIDEFSSVSIADAKEYIESNNKHYVMIGFEGVIRAGSQKIQNLINVMSGNGLVWMICQIICLTVQRY